MNSKSLGILLIAIGVWSILGWRIIDHFKLYQPGVGIALWLIPVGLFIFIQDLLKSKY